MDQSSITLLFSKSLSGEISPAEMQQLQALLRENAVLRHEYDLLKEYWTSKDVSFSDGQALALVRSRIIAEEGRGGSMKMAVVAAEEVAAGEAGPGRLVRMMSGWRKYAAVLLLIVCGYGRYVLVRRGMTGEKEKPMWMEKYASRGTRSTIILSDGTNIRLNADSRLVYPATFTGNTREVTLYGEAYFDVEKDPSHPFIIHTKKMTIRVLGTAFNVKSYQNDSSMEATLLSGSIEVTFPDRPSDRIILNKRDKLVIGNTAVRKDTSAASGQRDSARDAGEGTHYTLTGLTYYKPQDSTIVETGWLDNKLVFSNEDFENLAHRMERWYGVNIIFDNQAIAGYRFTGLFQKEPIRDALYALQLTEKFSYSMSGSTIHIY